MADLTRMRIPANLIRLRRPVKSKIAARYFYPVGTEATLHPMDDPDDQRRYYGHFCIPASIAPVALSDDWLEAVELIRADYVGCPVPLLQLSVEQWRILFWRIHGLGRLPSRKTAVGACLFAARRTLHRLGLLLFDDSTELSADGEATVSHCFDIARSLTEPQRRRLAEFRAGFGYAGPGGRQVLGALQLRRLAAPDRDESGGRRVKLSPLGHAVGGALHLLHGEGAKLPWEAP